MTVDARLYLPVQAREGSDCGRRCGHKHRITMRKEDTGNYHAVTER